MKLRLLFLSLFITSVTWGQILTFDFAGLTGSEVSATSNFNDANLTNSTISRGSGLTASNNADRFNATSWATGSIANAISGNNYMEFTITPNSGYQFSVSSVELSLQRSGTGPSALVLRNSLDGYSSNLDTQYTIIDNTSTQTFTFTFTQPNSLTPVVYRVYMYAEASGGSGGIGDFVGNDVVVNGLVTLACSPPANPSGTIAVTPSCGSSSLAYSLPSATTYWQTSATGTDTTFPTTSPYVATLDGTYYVRTFNGSCWSTGAVSQSVTLVNPVVITTQPTNQAVTTGVAATFNVVASNAVSYQWQVSTNSGGSWSNIGTNSTSYTTPATIIGMNGYLYRVIITGTAPCASVTSSEALLTVSTGPCVSENFNAFTGSNFPSGWSGSGLGNYSTAASSGLSPNSVQFNDTNDVLLTPTFTNAVELSFWIKGNGTNATSSLLIEGYNGVSWILINTLSSLSTSGTTITYNASSSPSLPSNLQQFRFTYTKSAGNLAFDDVTVICGTPPSGPEINVTGNGLTIADEDTTPSSSDNTNFGSTLIGSNIVQTFVIQNIGTTDLTLSLPITLSDTSLPQEFIITQPTTSTVVAGGSAFFTVTFNSAVAGLFTNTINIVNSDSDEALYNFDIVAIASTSATGGTVFNPGDLIFTGYDGQVNGSGAEDEYLVATLVDILPGTVFSIVNSRYEAGAAAGVRTNKWGGGGDDPSESPYQADITYSGSTTIPAGSVLQIITNGTANWFGTINVITGTVSTNQTVDFSGSVVGGTFLTPNISTSSPDQMYLVQGTFISDGTIDLNQANYYLSGTLLHGLTNRAAWVPLVNACSGSSSTTSSNPRESRLPASLTCFNVESLSSSAVSGYYENDKEHGLASKYQIINAVADVTNNWTLGTSRYTLDPASSAANRAGKTFIIGPSNPSGQWVGDIDTNWFNCANWSGLVVPDSNTNVIINASATNVARIDYTATYSDDYSDLAVANDINILGSKVEILANSNNVLEVFGDLLIDSSGVLDMDDSNSSTADGKIILHGNWTNNINENAFEEGNGIIVFKGTTDQLINAVVPQGTEVFYDVTLNNNFTTNVSNNLIATGDLIVETGKLLTINANNYIQVNKDLTVDGTLNVLNNGSLIQVDDTGVNTGNISYERITTGNTFDYVYWSSPVDGFKTPSSGYVFSWNPTTTNTNGGLGYWIYALGIPMEPGVGYIMRDVFTRTFDNGIARNGIISTPIERGNYTGANYSGTNGVTITNLDDNLNLIGNPYPSSINAIDFLTANTNIEGAVRLWTHGIAPSTSIQNPFYGSYQANYSINDYVIYNSTGSNTGVAGFNGFIAGGQGFFVIMNDGAATSENVVFNNAMRSRTYDNSQFYRSASSNSSSNEKSRVWLDLKSNNQSAKTLIGYVNGATMGKDRMYDAAALASTETSIYSIVDSKNMIIQGRYPFSEEDIVTLGVKITSSGTSSIGIHAVDGLFQEQDVYLEDLYLNVIHDLRTAAYSFTSQIGVFEDRFVIRYKNPTLSNTNFDLDPNLIQISIDQYVQIRSLSNKKIKSVEVFDVLARRIFEKSNVNSASIFLNELAKNHAPLFVKVELEDSTILTKKIVY